MRFQGRGRMGALEAMVTAMDAVIDETEAHCHELEFDGFIEPSERRALQLNLSAAVTRGLTLIGMHQLLLSMRLDELAGVPADQQVFAD